MSKVQLVDSILYGCVCLAEEIKSRRKSAGQLTGNSNLSSMNKSLAKSSSALNYRPEESNQFRGNFVL